MEILFLLFALIPLALLIYFLWSVTSISRLKRDVISLHSRLQSAEQKIAGLTDSGATDVKPVRKSSAEQKPASVSTPVQPPDPVVAPVATTGKAKSPAVPVKPPRKLADPAPAVPKVTFRNSALWQKIEGQFSENWTGILGAIILVMGVGFLGIYAALVMTPFMRFCMIVAFALLLAGVFYRLKSYPDWLKLALWLRSAAGAIFLFACIGAGGVEGIQWIENTTAALALLVFGIVVNLYLGYAGGEQSYASLHVVLSLVALGIAPQDSMIFALASMVALSGIAYNYREKWDYHLLLTLFSYFVYHLYWYFSNDGILSGVDNNIGIAGVAITGIAAAMVHYREAYATRRFDKIPFAVHLVNWAMMGLGLLMHSTGSRWKTILLAIAAVAAFGLARVARRREIRWLYLTDTLISHVIALIALVTLTDWEVDYVIILGLVFLQTLLFAVVMAVEKEPLLYRIATHLAQLAGLVLVVSVIGNTVPETMHHAEFLEGITLMVSAIAGAAFHAYTLSLKQDDFNPIDHFPGISATAGSTLSIISLLSCGMLLTGYLNLYPSGYAGYVLMAAGMTVLYLRERFQSSGFGYGMLALLMFVHAILFGRILPDMSGQPGGSIVFTMLPFILLSAAAYYWSWFEKSKRRVTFIGIYLLGAHLMALVYYLTVDRSSLLPGVIWLALSPILLEIARLKKPLPAIHKEHAAENGPYLLQIAYIFMAGFLIRHILVHLQAESFIGPFKVRFLIEMLALAIFAYWATTGAPRESTHWTWRNVQPMFLEAALLFLVFTVSLEVSEYWHPLIWVGLSFATLGAGTYLGAEFSRLRFYSLLFGWAAAFQVAFLSSSYALPSTTWYGQSWVIAAISIVLQVVHLYAYYRHAKLAEIEFPPPVRFLPRLLSAVRGQRNRWIFYPVIASIAIFLYWSFDSSILTLLWVAECFMIFVLSVFLKENHFRHVALIGLGACLTRLFFFDLASAATLTKALVFLGVGVIMLLINSIYNKYKDRFVHE